MRPPSALVIVAVTAALAMKDPPTAQGQTPNLNSINTSKVTHEAPRFPLVANGYCVVTLRDAKKWRQGSPLAATFFDGREYRFTGPREQAIFLAAPETYAPVLGGDCPVTYAESKQRQTGQLRCAILHRGRICLFADESCVSKFTQQPQLFENIDLVDGGLCPVTRRAEHRDVAGNPATVAVYSGRRYFFASMHQRQEFLANPEKFGAVFDPQPPATIDAAVPDSLNGDGSVAHPSEAAEQSPKNTATDRSPGESMLIDSQPAMGGYCVVSIRENGVWVRGRYDYRVEFGGLVLLTAGPAEHDALLHDPVKYIPALSGDCAATWIDDGQRVRGSIFHAAEYHGRLFLFADAQRKAAFKADPERYVSADVAAQGECRVTQVDERRVVPGSSAFSAWHGGLVYYFADAQQKQKFLAQPERYSLTPSGVTDGSASTFDSP